jgi:hypothetical protein
MHDSDERVDTYRSVILEYPRMEVTTIPVKRIE